MNKSGNRIYNGFMFFNEFDCLDIRLNELWDVVDVFILVEARKGHRGKEKPLHFEQRKQDYEKYLPKIRHIILDDLCFIGGNPWIAENSQRAGIMNGIGGITGSDYLVITDADEIPKSDALYNYTGNCGILSMDFFYYHWNLKNEYKWNSAKIVRYGAMDRCINSYRLNVTGCDIIEPGGWHFSKVYCTANLKYMFENHLADDLNKFEIINNLEAWKVKGETHWCGHDNYFRPVNIDDSFPLYIRNNIDRFVKNCKL